MTIKNSEISAVFSLKERDIKIIVNKVLKEEINDIIRSKVEEQVSRLDFYKIILDEYNKNFGHEFGKIIRKYIEEFTTNDSKMKTKIDSIVNKKITAAINKALRS